MEEEERERGLFSLFGGRSPLNNGVSLILRSFQEGGYITCPRLQTDNRQVSERKPRSKVRSKELPREEHVSLQLSQLLDYGGLLHTNIDKKHLFHIIITEKERVCMAM